MKRTALAFLLLSLSRLVAQAEIKPVVHYNFGKAGNVTYAATPTVLHPAVGRGELRSAGQPVFYADAPADRKLKGEGSILFDGRQDGYRQEQALGTADGNRVLEIWVKAAGPDTLARQTVVSHGTATNGYAVVRHEGQWRLLCAGQETEIGAVVPGRWTHLAVAIDQGKGTLWYDGHKSGEFLPSASLAPNFSVAVSESGTEAFRGSIYEIRYSAFADGAFRPEADLLLYGTRTDGRPTGDSVFRSALLEQLEAPGYGKSVVRSLPDEHPTDDWLIRPVRQQSRLYVQRPDQGGNVRFRLSNGLVSRTFYLGDNLACISYRNLSDGAEYLRAVKPEARIRIDSIWYDIGGLTGQPELSYLLEEWLPQMKTSPRAFSLEGIETGVPEPRYPWTPQFHAAPADWPPKGLRLTMTFAPTGAVPEASGLRVRVHYEIYDGIPVIAKWIEVENGRKRAVLLRDMECEVLAVNQDQVSRLHVESDYSFALVNADLRGSALMHYAGTPKAYHVGGSTTRWIPDPDYNTWASHNQAEDKFLGFPHHNLLVSKLPMGPCTRIAPDSAFRSYVTFELLHDSDDRERQSLAHRRMYRKLAPQVTESLIAAGITSHDSIRLKALIDQMDSLGFEQLDIQAWPGVSHDNLDSAYVRHWRGIAAYAASKGIVMGGYELQIASRGRGDSVDCVHPETGRPGSLFGQSVCVASRWQDDYFPKMWEFFDRTGFRTYNMDGPYHGDPCASTAHPHHDGLEDSQWRQWSAQVAVLRELRRRGVYIPIPDWYFLNGQNVTGMGYREASANLTPQQQLLLGRQYIYDGTWHKLPTMGWMTLQLVGFYTDDPRVGLEPLCENLERYEAQLFQYLASGCHLTVRGNRLYDTPQTREMVQRHLDWFRKYRDILTSEIIHVSRPTGRDLDCMMHVNPFIRHKGMVVVFNPTGRKIEKTLRLPLYYTGLQRKVRVSGADGKTVVHPLNDRQELSLPVGIEAGGHTWFLLEE